MRRASVLAAVGVALAVLIVADFGPVLFRGRQFGYRDAAHYYYPMHARTQAQWNAGHLPLWDPSQNGGMPLIGDPTAAVLYPGKVVFALFPYPWAARLYVIGHTVLAFATMAACLRGLGVGAIGAALGGLSYAFGGPVLFQYCNVLFLVGAAWLPLGIMAADGWIRHRRRRSLALLAVVLTMQCLGGDVETAYVMGVFAAGYGLWYAMADRWRRPSRRSIALAGAVWIGLVLALAAWLPTVQGWAIPPSVLLWGRRLMKWAIWILAAMALLRAVRGRGAILAREWGGLVLAAAVGAAVAGVQLVPVAEFASVSFRIAGDREMDTFGFSLEPYRLAELLWPGVTGLPYPENHVWIRAIPPIDAHEAWVDSVSLGGLTVLLAIAAMAGREGPAWRGPMAVMAAAGLWLSLGQFGGPLWWARDVPGLGEILGPHRGSGSALVREDGFLRDGVGSAYWLVATVLPGFDSFRYPAKLLVFASFAISALAGLGWDRAASGSSREVARAAKIVCALGVIGLALSFAAQGPLLSWWARSAKVPSTSGPIDPVGAMGDLRRGLLHGTVAMLAAAGVAMGTSRGGRWAGPAAIILLAADLAYANARTVWTVPQAEFDRVPAAARAIAEAEAKDPSPGPFRVQRLPAWYPVAWVRARSPDRLREEMAWGRDSLQSGFGTIHGLPYVLTPGALEPEAYVDMFRPWTIRVDSAGANALGIAPGQPIRYHPRRAFDLWGARYFLLPVVPAGWLDPNRAIASFLADCDRILPDPKGGEISKQWREEQDWQILRNRAAFPRAWVVHDVKVRPGPIRPGSPESERLKKSLFYQADPFWNIPGRPVEDPRTTAWVESDDPSAPGFPLAPDGGPTSASETVTVARERSGRVELEAVLERPGLVVVADTFYPGWTLTIDGAPAPIWKTNLAMRGAAVGAGRHRLVFSYEPGSLRIGLIVSCLGLIGLGLLALAPTGHLAETRTSWEP